jgi:hypothetical protein
VKTSFRPPVRPAQPPLTSAQPVARRGSFAANRKPATSTASGTVTAVSPKSVRKRQTECNKRFLADRRCGDRKIAKIL